jgi:predicted  nucleic acid-binding Zn-ribbon protein
MIFYILFFSYGYGTEDSKKNFCPFTFNPIIPPIESEKINFGTSMSIRNIDCAMLKPPKDQEQNFIIGSPMDDSIEPLNHQTSIIFDADRNIHKQFLAMASSPMVPSPLDSRPLKSSEKININQHYQSHRFENDIKNLLQRYKNLETKNENLYRQNQKQDEIIHQLQKQINQLQKEIKDISGKKSQLFQELMDEKQKNIQLEKQIESITNEKTKENPPLTPKKSSINFTSNPLIMEFTSYKSPLKCFLDDKNNEINHQSFLRELNHFEQKIHQLLKENMELFEENNALKEKFDQSCEIHGVLKKNNE